jgi:beta-1,2-mannobiose phosphorylase / 1,2-beta-oligomannan phosphorylase
LTVTADTSFPYRLTRLGVVMAPDRDDAKEVEGVLNPASGRGADGRPYLLPRLVAERNVSRVGLAEILLDDADVPVGVRRCGLALEPDAGFERGRMNAGVEDPRVTFLPRLGVHAMAYVAYGPLGPRLALAVSPDLRTWRRLGPVSFGYDPALDTDVNLFPNKDAGFFSEPVPGPDGRPAYALVHRPMWDLGWLRPGEGTHLPKGVTDDRPGIWVSYVPAEEAEKDVTALTRLRDHRLIAMPEYPWEELKIGAGPAPVRVPEGWLLIHHGVAGADGPGAASGADGPDGADDPGGPEGPGEAGVAPFQPAQRVRYAAGAMILDPDDVTRVIARTAEPLLEPETAEERDGTVPDVVFPTAVERFGETWYVFYGMADAHIGVARLDRIG